jgi:hypothetical protein
MIWLQFFLETKWKRLRRRAVYAILGAEECMGEGQAHAAAFLWLESALLFWQSAALAPSGERPQLYDDAEDCARHSSVAAERFADFLMWQQDKVRTTA